MQLLHAYVAKAIHAMKFNTFLSFFLQLKVFDISIAGVVQKNEKKTTLDCFKVGVAN